MMPKMGQELAGVEADAVARLDYWDACAACRRPPCRCEVLNNVPLALQGTEEQLAVASRIDVVDAPRRRQCEGGTHPRLLTALRPIRTSLIAQSGLGTG
jgi:hypothetical protein